MTTGGRSPKAQGGSAARYRGCVAAHRQRLGDHRLGIEDEVFPHASFVVFDVLEILNSSIEESQDEQVTAAFRQHRDESQGHHNFERAFELLGVAVDDYPCPAIDGLQAEGKADASRPTIRPLTRCSPAALPITPKRVNACEQQHL